MNTTEQPTEAAPAIGFFVPRAKADWGVLTLVLVLAITAAVSIGVFLHTFRWIGDITSPESAVVTISLDFAHYGKLYRSLDQPPYTVVAYGPAMYAVLAGFARFTGAAFSGLLLAGRLFTLCCYLLLGGVVYFGCKRSEHGNLLSIATVLLLWADPIFARWNVTVRPDMPALLLSVLAIVLCTVPFRSNLFWAGICAGCAVLFKQTYVAASLSIVIWYLWRGSSERRWRTVAEGGLFCAFASLPILATVCFFALRHDPFLAQAGLMGNVFLSRSVALQLLKQEWHRPALPLLLLSCGIGLWSVAREAGIRGQKARLVALYTALAWLIAAVSSLNTGSSANYYLEPHASLVLAAPFVLYAVGQHWRSTAKPIRMLLFTIVLLALLKQGMEWKYEWLSTENQPSSAALRDLAAGARVLSTASYFSALSSQPELLDPFLSHQLELRRRWSAMPIKDEIQIQTYDYVILRHSNGRVEAFNGYFWFSRAVTESLSANYKALCQTTKYLVLIPRTRSSNRDLRRLYESGCKELAPETHWMPDEPYQ